MLEDTLEGGRSSRYRHAARHLAECRSSDTAIESYGAFSSHDAFLQGLREAHSRKHGFWRHVEA